MTVSFRNSYKMASNSKVRIICDQKKGGWFKLLFIRFNQQGRPFLVGNTFVLYLQ